MTATSTTDQGSSPGKLECVPADMRDWETIIRLIAAEFPLVDEPNVSYWLTQLLPYFHVARLDGRTVGFIFAQANPEHQAWWLDVLAVDRTVRNRGIASLLMDRFEHCARESGIGRAGLQCLGDNVAALKLYERLGYSQIERAPADRLGREYVVHTKQVVPVGTPTIPAVENGHPLPAWRRMAYKLAYRLWMRPRTADIWARRPGLPVGPMHAVSKG